MKGKVIFIGAGPGDPDLITVKGRKVIEQADVIIYAGSLVNKDVLCPAKDDCEIHNSAYLNLDETDAIITEAVNEGKLVARVHTGDPSIYGAIGEQIRELKKHDIEYEIIPGVSSLFGTASVLEAELAQMPDSEKQSKYASLVQNLKQLIAPPSDDEEDEDEDEE